MYLLYLDDSGSASNPKEQHLVLAGVYLDLIMNKFDSDRYSGKLHGLIHKTADTGCMCPACMSRRLADAQSVSEPAAEWQV